MCYEAEIESLKLRLLNLTQIIQGNQTVQYHWF